MRDVVAVDVCERDKTSVFDGHVAAALDRLYPSYRTPLINREDKNLMYHC